MKIRLIDCCCCCFADKLHERQRDPDERVRQEVVATICDAAVEQIEHIDDKVLQVLSVQVHCTAPGCVLNVLAGLLRASRWWPDILPGQRNFSLVKSHFWLVKIVENKLTYPFESFTLWTQLCFFKETKFKIYGCGFGCFFHERECMRDQSICPVVTEVFGKASCNSGQILSFDQLLFWALLHLALYSNVLT